MFLRSAFLPFPRSVSYCPYVSKCYMSSTSPNESGEVAFIQQVGKKYARYEGGDFNKVEVLGAVHGVYIAPLAKSPERDWARLFVRTSIPHPTLRPKVPIEEHQIPESTISADSHRIHVFNRRLMELVHRIHTGDRIFVSGFISYYKSPETDARNLAVVAEKIILMSSLIDQDIDMHNLDQAGADGAEPHLD